MGWKSLDVIVFACIATAALGAGEILWFRAIGVASQDLRSTLALLVVATGIGVGLGWAAAPIARKHFPRIFKNLLLVITLGVVGHSVAWSVPVLLAWLVGRGPLLAIAGPIALTALLTTLVCAIALPPRVVTAAAADKASTPVRTVRSAEVFIVQVLGILGGWGLVRHLGLGRAPLALLTTLATELGALSLLWLLWRHGGRGPERLVGVVLVLALAVGPLVLQADSYNSFWQKLLTRNGKAQVQLSQVVEGAVDVLTVTAQGELARNGQRQGLYTASIGPDHDKMARAYVLAAVTAPPANFTMLGLGAAGFAQVLANFSTTQQLTVVEGEPAAVLLAQQQPTVASLTQQTKVQWRTAEPLAWLQNQAPASLDAIVVPAWLPQFTEAPDFAQIIAKRLRPSGLALVVSPNPAHQRLLCEQFPGALRIYDAILGSNQPVVLSREQWRQALLAMTLDGKPVLQVSKPEQERDMLLALALANPASYGGASADVERCSTLLARSSSARAGTRWFSGDIWRGIY